MRIFDPHRSALDPQNPIRGVAELEDIALQAFDREVFVHGADQLRFGLQHDAVVGIVRNGAAGGDRGQARALARPQHFVDGVVMDQRAAPSAPGAESFGQHAHALVELRASEIPGSDMRRA